MLLLILAFLGVIEVSYDGLFWRCLATGEAGKVELLSTNNLHYSVFFKVFLFAFRSRCSGFTVIQ